jgi:hypothetical protein
MVSSWFLLLWFRHLGIPLWVLFSLTTAKTSAQDMQQFRFADAVIPVGVQGIELLHRGGTSGASALGTSRLQGGVFRPVQIAILILIVHREYGRRGWRAGSGQAGDADQAQQERHAYHRASFR